MHFLSVVFISCSICSIYPTYLVVVSFFSHISFLFLFESSVSFVFRIDSFATRESIITVLFFLVFWFLLLRWFYLVLVSVPQEPQEGETRGVSM
jgi:hypothetical protein